MKLFGYNITKAQKNAIQNIGKRVSLSDMLKDVNGKIKIDKAVFYELYKRNGDVRQAIQKIAKHVGKKGMYLEGANGTVITNGKEFDIKRNTFSIPTPLAFKIEFFRSLIVGGEVYIVPVKNGRGETVSFKMLDPRSMTIKFNKTTGEIVGFTQMVMGQKIEFTADELSYYRFESDPDNEYHGLSLLEGPVIDLLSDKTIAERNNASIEDGYLTEAIIRLREGLEMGIEEYEIEADKVRSQLEEKGRKYIVSNTIEGVDTLSFSPRDIDYINQRGLTTDKVSASLGVPKSILGYTESVNYSNGATQMKEFIEGTVIPYQEFLAYVINDLCETYGVQGNNKVVLVNDGFEDAKEIQKGQREDIKLGVLSIDEVRKERNYPEWKIKGKTDKPLIVSNITPLDTNENIANA